MRTRGSIPILCGLLLVLGASEAAAYVVDDSIKAGENVTFGWTKDGKPFSPAWHLTYQCAGDPAPSDWAIAPGVPFNFNNLRPDLAGQHSTTPDNLAATVVSVKTESRPGVGLRALGKLRAGLLHVAEAFSKRLGESSPMVSHRP